MVFQNSNIISREMWEFLMATTMRTVVKIAPGNQSEQRTTIGSFNCLFQLPHRPWIIKECSIIIVAIVILSIIICWRIMLILSIVTITNIVILPVIFVVWILSGRFETACFPIIWLSLTLLIVIITIRLIILIVEIWLKIGVFDILIVVFGIVVHHFILQWICLCIDVFKKRKTQLAFL